MADLANDDDYDDLAYRMSLPDPDEASNDDLLAGIKGVHFWLIANTILLALLLWRLW